MPDTSTPARRSSTFKPARRQQAAGSRQLAGIYGMNFRHMPELSWRFGYPLVLAVMVAICLWLYHAFRHYGWL